MNMTLSERLWLNSDADFMKRALMMVAGVCALAISAKLQFPVGFLIPGTMQLLVVLVIGSAYGAKMGGITLLSYLLVGAAGLPVFLGPVGGLAYFMGPTGGYLIGFLVAAIVVGLLAERGFDRNPLTMFIMMFVGLLIVHAFGSGWLMVLARMDDAYNWFVGFLLYDLGKAMIAVIAFPAIWQLIGEKR